MNDVLDDSLLMPTLAKKRDRVFAAMIDLSLVVIVAIIITTTFGNPYETADGRSGYRLTGPLTLIPLFLWVLIVPALEGFTGQSLGKSFLGIKVKSKAH